MSRRSYLQKDWNLARRQAVEAFKNHVVTKEGEGRWLFAKPDTGIYHMRVLQGPRMIMCYGDIGSLIMIPSDNNAFNWLSGCLSHHGSYDPCYIAEKVPHEVSITDFSHDRVKARIAELREVAAGYAESFKASADDYDLTASQAYSGLASTLEDYGEFESASEFYDSFYRAVRHFKLSYDDGPPSVEGLTHQFFFQLEAFRYFFMRFNEQAG